MGLSKFQKATVAFLVLIFCIATVALVFSLLDWNHSHDAQLTDAEVAHLQNLIVHANDIPTSSCFHYQQVYPGVDFVGIASDHTIVLPPNILAEDGDAVEVEFYGDGMADLLETAQLHMLSGTTDETIGQVEQNGAFQWMIHAFIYRKNSTTLGIFNYGNNFADSHKRHPIFIDVNFDPTHEVVLYLTRGGPTPTATIEVSKATLHKKQRLE